MLSAGGLLVAGQLHATTIVYNDFSSLSGLQLNGSTASIANPVTTGDGKVLRLTDDLFQGGSAFSSTTILLNNAASFSSFFKFRITDPRGIGDEDGVGADGLVFVVQTVANNVGGFGGGIGYDGIPNSVGIEFDTYNNGGIDGNNGNHVGVNLGGNISSVARQNIGTRMNNGDIWYSWVDYNGATDLLEVRLSQTGSRPLAATLSYTVDLLGVLGQPNAYVGFTSGTGSASGDHDILAWEFRDDFRPVIDPPSVPDGGSTLGLMALGMAGLAALRRKGAKA